ncbi:DUF2946 domain-containing protein [Phytopseudomonas dryadis]|uniref:DUF2946 domain-containing protein n=1 Tax=Phytopseudomonas dryadis TaxID=2487520 RepID=A0ABY1Z4G6_9GAMM|nr:MULTISPECIES: DUF2946 domain-containing protein [Pseudomonas]TBV04138.1 DUF2946 domain-containing protein [Pseudomonas dryadis]TBV16970.1 DUF2946 domain-containing protein [Pseudomonas sp. FRB 230]
MNLSRSDRSLLAWVLYFSVLFSAFACSISHGQMTGLQLSGMDGGYCALDASGGAAMAMDDVDSGMPMPSTGSGCPLCSTFAALALAAFFALLGLLPRLRSLHPRPGAEPGGAVRYLWPSANPRASPLIA